MNQRSESVVKRAMDAVDQAVNSGEADNFQAAFTGHEPDTRFTPRLHPAVNMLGIPSPQLINAINNWCEKRKAFAMAESAFHDSMMQLIRAEDEERKQYALRENNR